MNVKADTVTRQQVMLNGLRRQLHLPSLSSLKLGQEVLPFTGAEKSVGGPTGVTRNARAKEPRW